MATRRFDATPETILRDMTKTLVRMNAGDVTIALGGKMSQEMLRQYKACMIGVIEMQIDLSPYGAAIAFVRNKQRYRFACTKYTDTRDNLRAAQLALTLLWRIQEDYGVSEGREAQESFDRLFGGHQLALGDGTGGEDWHTVLHVAPTAGLAVIAASYRALAKLAHPDRNAGDSSQMVRLNRAYAAAQSALGAQAQ